MATKLFIVIVCLFCLRGGAQTLLLHYSFDTGTITTTNVLDQSGHAHHGVNMQGTNWIYSTNGAFNQAGWWTTNGVMTNAPPSIYPLSTYLAITNVAGLVQLTNFSLSVWLWEKTSDQANYHRVWSSGRPVDFSGGNPAAASNAWNFSRHFQTRHDLRVFDNNPSDDSRQIVNWPNTDIISSSPLNSTMTNWNHYALTITCTGDQAIAYHNGAAYQTNTVGLPYLAVYGSASTRWVCIGADAHGGSPQWGDDDYPNDGMWHGGMDELRLYDGVLTAAQITSLYSSNTLPDQGGANPTTRIQLDGRTIVTGGISFQ